MKDPIKMLEIALQDFIPGPQKRVMVWIHSHQEGEHWVGELSDFEFNENRLIIGCKWTIRVEPNKQENENKWRVIVGSKTENPVTIDTAILRFADHEKIEICEQNGDVVNFYTSGDRIMEADTLFKNYLPK